MGELVLGIKIFIFILSILNILKDVYKFLKVMRKEEGVFDNGKYGSLFFGLSLSYIITLLIIGF